MLYAEFIEDNTRVRHYSDTHLIRQIETGNIYEDTVDYLPCKYTYEETTLPLPEDIEE